MCCSPKDWSAWSVSVGHWSCLHEGGSARPTSWHLSSYETCWAGPLGWDASRGHMCQSDGSVGWSQLPEAAAADPSWLFRRQVREGNSGPVFVSGPVLDPGRVWFQNLHSMPVFWTRASSGSLLTQTLWNAGPQRCRNASWVEQLVSVSFVSSSLS